MRSFFDGLVVFGDAVRSMMMMELSRRKVVERFFKGWV